MRSGLSILNLVMMAALVTGGGVGAALYTGAVQIPDVELADTGAWGEVTGDYLEIVTTVHVNNPNEFDIDLRPVSIAYSVYMNDVLMARGSQHGENIPSGNSTVDISTELLQSNIADWWVSHMENDEVTTVTAEATVDLETAFFSHSIDGIDYTHEIDTELLPMLEKALSSIEDRYTYRATGLDIVDPEIVIRDTSAEWGAITRDETELLLTLDVYNPNPYPLPTPEFVGQLEMNGVQVADWDAHDVNVAQAPTDGVIAPQTANQITLGIALDHDAVTEWMTAHIEQGEHSTGTLQARMAFTINDQRFYLPPRGSLHCEFRFWTAILEDQEQRMEDRGCSFRNVGLMDEEAHDTGETDDDTDDGEDDGGDGDEESGGLMDGLL